MCEYNIQIWKFNDSKNEKKLARHLANQLTTILRNIFVSQKKERDFIPRFFKFLLKHDVTISVRNLADILVFLEEKSVKYSVRNTEHFS